MSLNVLIQVDWHDCFARWNADDSKERDEEEEGTQHEAEREGWGLQQKYFIALHQESTRSH